MEPRWSSSDARERSGARPIGPPFWTAALLAAVLSLAGATGEAAGQRLRGWTVERDALTDLWFHGLSVVGFDGFGPVPLYSPAYAAEADRHMERLGLRTPLSEARGSLLATFASGPSFEVLHFVPLYFVGVDASSTLEALTEALGGGHRVGEHAVRSSRTAAAIAHALPRDTHRRAVARFVETLHAEEVVMDALDAAATPVERETVERSLERLARGPLADFLGREGLVTGRVILTPALGLDGRFLEPEGRPLVAVGASRGDEPGAVVGAVIRELCYPAVRRVLGPFESRFDGRRELSEVSYHVATRCGARLLEAHAPEHLPAYLTRFGADYAAAGFLSAVGAGAAAVLEAELDARLEHELHLSSDESGDRPRSVRR